MKVTEKLIIIGIMLALLAGCSSIRRWSGITVTIHGILRRADDQKPAPELPLIVSGTYISPTFPIMASFRRLKNLKSDASGRFECVVPYYFSYRFDVGGEGSDVFGHRIIDTSEVRSKEIVIEVRPPNKTSEPTTMMRPPATTSLAPLSDF